MNNTTVTQGTLFEELGGVAGPHTLQTVSNGARSSFIYICGEHHRQPDNPNAQDIQIPRNPFPHITDVILSTNEEVVCFVEMSPVDCIVLSRAIESSNTRTTYQEQSNYRRSPLQRLGWMVASSLVEPSSVASNVKFVLCNRRTPHPLQLITAPSKLSMHLQLQLTQEKPYADRGDFAIIRQRFLRDWVKNITCIADLRRLLRKILLSDEHEHPLWWKDAVNALHLQNESSLAVAIRDMRPLTMQTRCKSLIVQRIRELTCDDKLYARLTLYLQDCINDNTKEPGEQRECIDATIREYFATIGMLIQDGWMMVEYSRRAAKHNIFFVGDAHLRMLSPFFTRESSCDAWQSARYVIQFNVPTRTCEPSDVDADNDAMQLALGQFLTTQGFRGGGGASGGERSRMIPINIFNG